jgi:hypothetical protein
VELPARAAEVLGRADRLAACSRSTSARIATSAPTLPITGAAARAIETQLWSDVREENRYYYYDHFRDNCATRLRDMIDRATGGALSVAARYTRTFRSSAGALSGMPLLLVISDLITGRGLDGTRRCAAMFPRHPADRGRTAAARRPS